MNKIIPIRVDRKFSLIGGLRFVANHSISVVFLLVVACLQHTSHALLRLPPKSNYYNHGSFVARLSLSGSTTLLASHSLLPSTMNKEDNIIIFPNEEPKKRIEQWTPNDEQLLVDLVTVFRQRPKNDRVPWEAIAIHFFPSRTAGSLALYWKTSTCASISPSNPLPVEVIAFTEQPLVVSRSNGWSAEADKVILELGAIADKKGNWNGLELPKARTLEACKRRYKQLTSQSTKKGRRVREHDAWSQDEYQLLVDVVHAVKDRRQKPWTYIRDNFFSHRSQRSVRSLWSTLLKAAVDRGEYKPQPPSPEIKAFLVELQRTGIVPGILWSPEEDARLREGYGKYGPKWTTIAATCFDGIDYDGIKRKKKDRHQCLNRWTLRLDPSLSRAAWSEKEYAFLRQAVIDQYLQAIPNLDVAAIISRQACWPANVTMSFTTIAKAMAEQGYGRSSSACSTEWYANVDPSLIPPGTPWSDDEKQVLAEIKRNNGSSLEAWRQLHRPPPSCQLMWHRMSEEYDFGPLTITEQVLLLQSLHKLGEFNNRAIRNRSLPSRLSLDIKKYWRTHALRLQQIIFARYNADDSTRAACFGIDNPSFGAYFKQQNFSREEAEEVVRELETYKQVDREKRNLSRA